MFTLCLCVLVVMIGHDMRALWLGLVIVVSWSSIGANVSADPEPSNERPASQLYRRYCVSCHGNDGRAKTSKGKFSHARDLSDPQWQSEVSDERIFNSILNGRNVRGNMPPFSAKLNEKEVDSLVDFVRKLKGPQQ
jgi:mono/diheme cytochrome c family protein